MPAPSSSKSSSVDGAKPFGGRSPKRRRGPKHPGVVLIKPSEANRTGWRARYEDPDTEKTTWETLDASLTTAELREDWAARKSKGLARRRLELEGGAHRTTGTTLEKALKRYFDDHERLGAETLVLYRAAAKKLNAWAAKAGVPSADDLTGAKLVAFRATLVKEPKTVRASGGRRGERQEVSQPRSPDTVNRELRSIGTVLNYIRRLGLLPRLSADELSDGLQKLKSAPKRIDYRKPHELQKLLESAMRHDADTFAATREELAGDRPLGTTPRYTPIAPVLVAAIVTGLRFGHLMDLQWSDVDLEALDEHGNAVGEITPKGGSQTKRTGVIGLEVSPALRRLLAAMKLATGGHGRVFSMTRGEANAALKRLGKEYGAPAGCSWQAFRRTCGCFLTNAPGIFAGASAYRSAKQLGHSVTIAERHYVDVVRGIPREARTLEDAMQITAHVQGVIDSDGARPAARVRKIG